jgi:hypothetical protein
MKISWKNVFSFVLVIALGWLYTEYQHFFIPQIISRPMLVLFYLIIFTGLFILVRPAKIENLSKALSLCLTTFAAVIIGVEDLLIKKIPLEQLWVGTVIILSSTIFLPFIAGFIYKKITERRTNMVAKKKAKKKVAKKKTAKKKTAKKKSKK